ncbi:MAG: hypothetical protein KJ955_00050 [Nanoarchaeota archaeon]|nr:hypothetical protein [Nanoarchaeota archaeon]
MIKTVIFGVLAAAGYAALCGADTETIQTACMYLRDTPNSACGLEHVMHGLGSIGMAGGLTGLAGSVVGGGVGAINKPVGWCAEGLFDLIAAYLVVHSSWWTDNVSNMLSNIF